MNILKNLLLIVAILISGSVLTHINAMEKPSSPSSLMALCQQQFIHSVNNEAFDSSSLAYAFDYAQGAQLHEIEQSCLTGLYSELQQETKKGIDNGLYLIKNLNKEQVNALTSYVLTNSSLLKSLFMQPTKELMQVESNKATALAVFNDGKIVEGSGDYALRILNEDGTCAQTFKGHTGSVYAVALSKDEKRIVSGSQDTKVRIWDCESNNSIVLAGHTQPVVAVAISADGKRAVSGAYDNTIRVWDCETGACIKTLEGHSHYVTSVAISENGAVVASGSLDNTVRIWDIESGNNIVCKDHAQPVFAVALSGDGKKALSGSFDKSIRIWDCKSGICAGILNGHTSCVKALALSEDAKVIISGSPDKTVRLWNCETGHCLKILTNHGDFVDSIALSSNGAIMASADDQSVYIYKSDVSHLSNLNLESLLFLENNILMHKDSKQNYYDQLPQELKDKMDENK